MRALRSALGGLTTRGRCFLAAGLAASGCAVLLGQDDLLRVGLLLAVLPVLCAAVLTRTRFKVAGARRLAPDRVRVGEEARVFLRVDNVSRVSSGMLMLRDQVPQVLGARPQFTLDRVEPRGYREVSYRVRSDRRGRYQLGPLQLRLADPFGMCELTRSFATSDTLTVLPDVHPLPTLRLAGEWAGSGDSRIRSVAAAGDDDVVPRGYRHGDDMRRVHWRSTARYGELMVRREEQSVRRRCTLLLDTRAHAHRGAGSRSSLEWAVSAAASLAVHLLRRGYAVRVVTDTGAVLPGQDSRVEPDAALAAPVLDGLATVEASTQEALVQARGVVRQDGEGLLIALLGELDDTEVGRLSRLRRRAGGAVAVLLHTASWAATREGSEGELSPQARALRAGGWTVLTARAGDAVGQLWSPPSQGSAASPNSAAPAGEGTSPPGRPHR